MVRSGYPFRDPNRRDDASSNRRDESLGNRRDDMPGNRREEPPNNRREDAPTNRREPRPDRRPRPEGGAPSTSLGDLTGDVEELLRMLAGSDVTELQIERGELRVTIRRGSVPPTGQPPAAGANLIQPLHLGGLSLAPATLVAGDVRGVPASAEPPPASAPPARAGQTHGHPAAPILGEREHLLTSPMVGTFYAGSSPKEAPFVVEGDLVEAGQTIGIIEAMKIMNEIEAEVAGRVQRILARDGQGVEYGQPLMVIEEV
jgi:acetyl-CoA carboxylase biotin carboxyl carrier protein